jgi:hypothetical protein
MSRLPRLRKPKLSLASAGALMTAEEFDAVTDYDDRYYYELLEGVLVVGFVTTSTNGSNTWTSE